MRTLIILLLIAIAACTPVPDVPDETPDVEPPQETPDETPDAEPPGTPADFTECEEPRPEVCTRQYDPVCGKTSIGRSTYGNACDACADPLVTGYTPGECETEPAGETFMVCQAGGMDRSDFAEQLGYTCVEACPTGMDEYAAQIGVLCIRHIGEEEIASWPTCDNGLDCTGTCGKATVTTDEQPVEDPQYRCLPIEYSDFMIHRGLELLDENGQPSTVIA